MGGTDKGTPLSHPTSPLPTPPIPPSVSELESKPGPGGSSQGHLWLRAPPERLPQTYLFSSGPVAGQMGPGGRGAGRCRPPGPGPAPGPAAAPPPVHPGPTCLSGAGASPRPGVRAGCSRNSFPTAGNFSHPRVAPLSCQRGTQAPRRVPGCPGAAPGHPAVQPATRAEHESWAPAV